MQPFIHWLETSFSPRMAKVNNNVWVVSIKDAIMQVLPFILNEEIGRASCRERV